MNVGDRVRLKEHPTIMGTIHGHYKISWFVMELDKGFYSLDEVLYTRLYVVHQDSIEPISSETT